MEAAPDARRKRSRAWVRYALLLLTLEKTIQHAVVTLAFAFDWGGIRSTVAVSADLLMVLGGCVTVLFGLSFWGLIRQRLWAQRLVIGLALFDIVGEFVAQGTPGISLTVSFLVAIALLVLALTDVSTQRRGDAVR